MWAPFPKAMSPAVRKKERTQLEDSNVLKRLQGFRSFSAPKDLKLQLLSNLLARISRASAASGARGPFSGTQALPQVSEAWRKLHAYGRYVKSCQPWLMLSHSD